MNRRKGIFIAAAVLAVCALCYLKIGNPAAAFHNHRLEKTIASVGDREEVTLKEIVPFGWDAVYSPAPYASREEIAGSTGFGSPDIRENNLNEGMTRLLFVKGDRVTASVLGCGRDSGYCIGFLSRVAFDEHALFHVSHKDGIVTLIRAERTRRLKMDQRARLNGFAVQPGAFDCLEIFRGSGISDYSTVMTETGQPSRASSAALSAPAGTGLV